MMNLNRIGHTRKKSLSIFFSFHPMRSASLAEGEQRIIDINIREMKNDEKFHAPLFLPPHFHLGSLTDRLIETHMLV